MIPTIQILISLLVVTAAVGVVAARLKIPPAILLVITGLIVALAPGLPAVELAPELVLLGVSSDSTFVPSCCSRSVASRSQRSRWLARAIGYWVLPGRWAFC
jgi:hypothetical protein